MATTKIIDIIEPDLWVPYVTEKTMELSELIKSGIITQNALLNQKAATGGTTVNMPFWDDLTGESTVLDDTNAIPTEKITSSKDIAHVLIRAKGWSAHELASALAGDSAYDAITELVAQWWVRDEQRILLSILNGIFASQSMVSLLHDVPTKPLDAATVLVAKQRLGDAHGKLSTIIMHSMTYTKLQVEGAIVMVPNVASAIGPREEIAYPTYLGYRVIVDDGMPISGTGPSAVYTTYLFAKGVIGRGDGVPTDLTPVGIDRLEEYSTDRLFHRRAFLLHPFGIKWTGAGGMTGVTPTNAELSNGLNWERVVELKRIGIVRINHAV